MSAKQVSAQQFVLRSPPRQVATQGRHHLWTSHVPSLSGSGRVTAIDSHLSTPIAAATRSVDTATSPAASTGDLASRSFSDRAGSAPEVVSENAGKSIRQAGDALSSSTSSSGMSSVEESAKSLPKAADTAGGSSPAPSGGSSLTDHAFSSNSPVDSAASKAADAISSGTPPEAPSPSGQSSGVLDSVGDLTHGLLDKATGVTGELKDQAQSLTKELGSSLDNASGGISKQLESISSYAGDALQGTSVQLETAKAAATDLATGISNQLNDTTAAALNSLPAPVREAISAASVPVSKALADPTVSQTVAGVAVAYSLFRWLSGRFGGYAGLLKAEKASEILENENSVLIDVRSEERRLASGILDLRYGARSRGVALPLVSISRRSGTQVVKADVLPFQVAALLVRGLVKVNGRTKVIVLDDSEKRAVQLARAISSEVSLRAFVLQGGTKGWVNAGLALKQSTEYDGTAFDSLNDTLQGRVLPGLRSPVTAVTFVSLSTLAAAGAYDVHRTLEFIGVFGLLTTLGTAPVRYSSKEEAYNGLFGPFLGLGRFFGRFLPKSRASRPPAAVAGSSPSAATPVEAELVEESADLSGGPSVAQEDSKPAEQTQNADAKGAKTNV